MNRLLFFLLFLYVTTAFSFSRDVEDKKVKYPGGKTYMYRVTLKDKHDTPFSLSQPQDFLSAKALERRERQNILPDSTDLPINPDYISEIAATGVEVVSKSKWNNTLLVRCHKPDLMKKIAALDFVSDMNKVWTSPDSIVKSHPRLQYHTEFNRWDTISENRYGVTIEQVEMLGGVKLHNYGYTGKGMTIAVLDGGFMNADVIPCFQNIKVEGTADFVVPHSETIYKEMEHGTKVLSVMAANVPNRFVGTAPDASYWLIRCEDGESESLAEEDYWAAAVEFADSVGVDVINSSLGFHAFDDHSSDYLYSQLDGNSSLISHTASMLAAKGIVLVNSAGNDGMSSWKKINVPADADNILSVGAVSPNRRNAAFSSIGPTADGRVKPDVMALGSPTAVITGRGTIIKDVGTSFSTPVITGLVACLWQALRDKTAKEIIDIVINCSDNILTPDNIYGYGIPDFWKAYFSEKKRK
ncbi:MAG: S8 family serine peptidase [Prevotella sp.]|nr:S8 family serine peptidase [Prevotella sp.]